MVHLVVGSSFPGESIKLFLIPASAPQTGVQKKPWYVLSCLWMVHIKEPLLLIGKD